MAVIFSPGQLARRAEFYQQLAQLTGAGITLMKGLDQLGQHLPDRSYREPIRQCLLHLNEGYTFSEALRRVSDWLPPFDVALLHAGEESGRLEAAFRLLADYYRDRAQMARDLIAGLIYPAILLHSAVFILPFPQFFLSGDWVAYFLHTFGLLLPIYALVAFLIYAGQSSHGEPWRAWLERVLRPVPVLGTARHYLALARLTGALEALLSAGVNIIEAWELAATTSGSPAMRLTVHGWRPQLEGGMTPSEQINASPHQFPELFANLYYTGEVSGTLDDTLCRLHRYYLEESTRKLRALSQWVPRGVYLVIALLIAYRIVSFWSGYFQQIKGAAGW